MSPIWSSDGRTIYYCAVRRSGSAGSNVFALYRKLVSGMGPEEEVLTGCGASSGAMSPDGRFLAVVRTTEGKRKIWMLPDPGGPPGASLPHPLFPDLSSTDMYQPAWSPDGRWLAFASQETGSAEVYVVPFPGPGARVRISRTGVPNDPDIRFSPDGKQVLFVAGQRLVAVDIAVVGGQLQVGDSHAMFPVTGRFDMSPDGRRFLVWGQGLGNEPLTIVQNWTRALAR